MPQDYLEEENDRVWASKRSALLDDFLERIEAQLNLGGAHDNKLWIPHSEGHVLLTGRDCAPQRGHKESEKIIFHWCLGLFMISTAMEQASVFACPGSQQYVF